MDSIGDEGSYLYKGYMFAKGDYYPFQEYTFWTNKTPLSFLIPGYIQYWFGPGLAVGRYFAIFVSILMVVGVWIIARRLGGRNWAAVAVWVFSLANANIPIYSEAISQGLVACMMAWVFVFTLGEERPLWQLIVGSGLSMLVVMTRQNMAVVPPLLIAYIFWQYGKRAGWWAFLTSAVIFIGFHIVYWPNIMQIWSVWLPGSLTPFLDQFRDGSPYGSAFEGIDLTSRIQSFATGIHDHFFVLGGAVSALILWPKKDSWKSANQFKMSVLLALMFFTLFFMHTWASLPTGYCVYCFSAYHTFYSVAGLLLVVIVFSNHTNDSIPRRLLLVVNLLFFISVFGLSYYKTWADWYLNHIQIPRL